MSDNGKPIFRPLFAPATGALPSAAVWLPAMFFFAALFLAGGCRHSRPAKATSAPSANTTPAGRRISLVFAGDVMQHAPQVSAARSDSTYDYTDCFRYIKPFFDSADLVVLNLETPLGAGPPSGYPLFNAPEELAQGLRNSGADIVMTANNHICDKGRRGILTTLHLLRKAGLRSTGTFADSTSRASESPLYVTVKGIRLALLNYTYGTNGMPVPGGLLVNRIDTSQIASDLRRIDRTTTAHTVVFFHWGVEYARYPSREQTALADWCHRRGADLVIGSHPHVLQPVSAQFGTDSAVRGITVYSLGNFVSNQRWRYSDGGMAVRVEITERDSLPPLYKPAYLLTWVYTPRVNGRKRYYILPSCVADTMLRGDPAAQTAYERFAADSRALLADSAGFSEIGTAAAGERL